MTSLQYTLCTEILSQYGGLIRSKISANTVPVTYKARDQHF